jgi:hypothetical protein
MIEAAYLSARRRKLILVIHAYQGPGQKIWGEPITDEYVALIALVESLELLMVM